MDIPKQRKSIPAQEVKLLHNRHARPVARLGDCWQSAAIVAAGPRTRAAPRPRNMPLAEKEFVQASIYMLALLHLIVECFYFSSIEVRNGDPLLG
jgi:hypothetical protein